MIVIFCMPLSGHLNVLMRLMKQYGHWSKFTLIVPSYPNLRLNPVTHAELTNICTVIEINDPNELKETDPILWTMPRILNNIDRCLASIRQLAPIEMIIYDFFCLEGYICAKLCQIKSICSIPAFYDTYDQSYLENKLKLIQHSIDQLNSKLGSMVIDSAEFEMVSDGLLLYGDTNLVWSFKNIPRDLTQRKGVKLIYANGFSESFDRDINLNRVKKIYVSLGTVVMNNLWENEPKVRQFILEFFGMICNLFGNNPNYLVYISSQGKSLMSTIPNNFILQDHFNQIELLKTVDLFITHGGNNSLIESIYCRIPMIVIPFFGDQHQVADLVHAQQYGISFGLNGADRIDTHKPKDRVLDPLKFKAAVDDILTSSQYINNIKQISTHSPDLSCLLLNKIPFSNGDLLYGSNDDRAYYVSTFDDPTDFVIRKYQPFSSIMKNNTILPRIVDIYHDSILNDSWYTDELVSSNVEYRYLLEKYKTFLADEGCLNPAASFDVLCCLGLEFFISQGHRIHFVFHTFDPKINYVTNKELAFISQQHPEWIGRSVFFYRLSNNTIIPM